MPTTYKIVVNENQSIEAYDVSKEFEELKKTEMLQYRNFIGKGQYGSVSQYGSYYVKKTFNERNSLLGIVKEISLFCVTYHRGVYVECLNGKYEVYFPRVGSFTLKDLFSKKLYNIYDVLSIDYRELWTQVKNLNAKNIYHLDIHSGNVVIFVKIDSLDKNKLLYFPYLIDFGCAVTGASFHKLHPPYFIRFIEGVVAGENKLINSDSITKRNTDHIKAVCNALKDLLQPEENTSFEYRNSVNGPLRAEARGTLLQACDCFALTFVISDLSDYFHLAEVNSSAQAEPTTNTPKLAAALKALGERLSGEIFFDINALNIISLKELIPCLHHIINTCKKIYTEMVGLLDDERKRVEKLALGDAPTEKYTTSHLSYANGAQGFNSLWPNFPQLQTFHDEIKIMTGLTQHRKWEYLIKFLVDKNYCDKDQYLMALVILNANQNSLVVKKLTESLIKYADNLYNRIYKSPLQTPFYKKKILCDFFGLNLTLVNFEAFRNRLVDIISYALTDLGLKSPYTLDAFLDQFKLLRNQEKAQYSQSEMQALPPEVLHSRSLLVNSHYMQRQNSIVNVDYYKNDNVHNHANSLKCIDGVKPDFFGEDFLPENPLNFFDLSQRFYFSDRDKLCMQFLFEEIEIMYAHAHDQKLSFLHALPVTEHYCDTYYYRFALMVLNANQNILGKQEITASFKSYIRYLYRFLYQEDFYKPLPGPDDKKREILKKTQDKNKVKQQILKRFFRPILISGKKLSLPTLAEFETLLLQQISMPGHAKYTLKSKDIARKLNTLDARDFLQYLSICQDDLFPQDADADQVQNLHHQHIEVVG